MMHDLRRQSRLFDTEKLASAKIGIFGDGPIANMLCSYLSGLGIGNVVLIGSSVKRGRAVNEPLAGLAGRDGQKVKLIAETAGKINPDMSVLTYFALPDRMFVGGCNAVIDTTNDPESKYRAYRYCKEGRMLLVSCSSSGTRASIRAHSCRNKKGRKAPIDDILMKEFSSLPQGSFTSSMVAALAADEVRKEVCPVDADQRLEEKVSYCISSPERFFRGTVPAKYRNRQAEADPLLRGSTGKKALVVGAGGIGTYVILNLAMLGIHMDIYDHDSVESHNLNRQVIHFGAVGANKAEEAARKIGRVNRSIRVRGLGRKVTKEVLRDFARRGEKYDTVFSCVDNWECRQALDNYCRATRTPLFNGSVTTFGCTVDYSIPGKTHCLECGNDYRRRIKEAANRTLSCADLEANVVMPNAIVGAMMVAESMQSLLPGIVPQISGKSIRYDSNPVNSRRFVLENRRLLCSSRKYYRNDCRCHSYLEKDKGKKSG